MGAAAAIAEPHAPRHRKAPVGGWCTRFEDAPIPAVIQKQTYVPITLATIMQLGPVLPASAFQGILYIYRWTYGDWRGRRPASRRIIDADVAKHACVTVQGWRKVKARLEKDYYGAPVITVKRTDKGGSDLGLLVENFTLVKPKAKKTFVRKAPASGAAAKWAARKASLGGPQKQAALRAPGKSEVATMPSSGAVVILPGKKSPIPIAEACPSAASGGCPLIKPSVEKAGDKPKTDTTPVQSLPPGPPVVVMPTEQSRPVPLEVAVRGVRYRNDTGIPLALVPSVNAGILEVEVVAGPPANQRPTVEPNLVPRLREYLSPIARERHVALDDPYVERLVGILLGNEHPTPLPYFARLVEQKLKSNYPIQTGLFRTLAEQARKDFAAVVGPLPRASPPPPSAFSVVETRGEKPIEMPCAECGKPSVNQWWLCFEHWPTVRTEEKGQT